MAMRRLALLAAMAILLAGPPTPGSAMVFGGQSSVLPAIDADGRTLPLTVDQLDPEERARFVQLEPASDDARRFLYTRGYLRYCHEVVAGRLAPLGLPPLPLRQNWNRRFLSDEEATNILDVALGMKYVARMQASRP